MDSQKLIISEINTWVWLDDLEKKYGKPFTLDQVPQAEWDELANLGFNAIWLMGIWSRSPMGQKISQENVSLYEEYARSLPDWKMDDLPGSPYCIKDYTLDQRFGGNKSLTVLRDVLHQKGMKLILDFVPNHIAMDHVWVNSHPEFLIPGDNLDILRSPREYFQASNGIFCKGRDPFFPAWQDVAQLNAYSLDYRKAAARQLTQIGSLCDGLRCDMAMLMLNRVFSYTWQTRAGEAPQTEFWKDVISEARVKFPDMIFIAEAYWDLEWDLLQVGFDYCYDKRLYDRLIHESAETIRQHIEADADFQSHLLRFIENHDEDRAAAILSIPQLKAASVLAVSLPGAALLYEGQWEGRKARNQVLLGRRQPELVNQDIFAFYSHLLATIKQIPSDSKWQLCTVKGWDDNQSCRKILAYGWKSEDKAFLIIVNYANHSSQGRVNIPWKIQNQSDVDFTNLFEIESLSRNAAELAAEGLFIDLPAWGFHFFTLSV
jgi:glycosidase